MTEKESLLETARRVRAAREARNQTQAEAAAILKIPRTSYCQLENGKRGIGALELAALCERWGIPYSEMFVSYKIGGKS